MHTKKTASFPKKLLDLCWVLGGGAGGFSPTPQFFIFFLYSAMLLSGFEWNGRSRSFQGRIWKL